MNKGPRELVQKEVPEELVGFDKNKCIDCKERILCRDDFSAWLFFIIGLISTLAIRLVMVLMHFEPMYGQIAWYIGVVGFLVFFIYKFRIYYHRSKVIRRNNLVEKIEENRVLTKEERDMLGGILCSLSSRKESINYLFIFVLSALALIVAIYFDFIKY